MKSRPTGVRIKEDKLDFIKERERLSTVQQVVTFLVDKYWWEQKMNIQDLTRLNVIKQNEQATSNYSVNISPPKAPDLSPFQEYLLEVNDAGSFEKLGKTLSAAKKDDSLTAVEKARIELAGNAKRSELNF